MCTDQLFLPPAPPEWQRSGRFFLIALALHAVVLFYPLQLAVGKLDIPSPATIMVRLAAAVSPPPLAPHKAPVQPAQPTPKPEKAVTTPRPVLAIAPEQSSAPTNFAPAPPSSPPVSAAPTAPVSNQAPVATVSAARYDAAYLQNPRPNYPPLSRRLGEEGKVLLKVRVSTDGIPAAVDVEKSSNFVRLDEAARQVVTHWRFVPARRGDEAIEATVLVPLVFRLDN